MGALEDHFCPGVSEENSSIALLVFSPGFFFPAKSVGIILVNYSGWLIWESQAAILLAEVRAMIVYDQAGGGRAPIRD